METAWSFVDLSYLCCRICLQESELTNSLDDEVECGNDILCLKSLYTLLLRATEIQTLAFSSNSEHLVPTRICIDCTQKLLNAYDFICTIQRSETFLDRNQEIQPKESETSLDKVIHPNIKEEDCEIIEAVDDVCLLDENEDIKVLTQAVKESPDDFKNLDKNVNNFSHVQPSKKDDGQSNSTDSPVESVGNGMKRNQGLSIGSRLGTFVTSHWRKCPHCLRVFARNTTLEKHIKNAHTNVSAEHIAAVAPKPTEDKPIICDHCPRTFARQFALERHVRAMHPGDGNFEGKKNEKNYKRVVAHIVGVVSLKLA